jgi:hypothetical protein
MIHTLLSPIRTLFEYISLTMQNLILDLILPMRLGLCFLDLELVLMRYHGYKIYIDLVEPCSWVCIYCVVADVPLNKGNFAEIYSWVMVWGSVQSKCSIAR